jgi:multidrug efflux pump subunit AcrB
MNGKSRGRGGPGQVLPFALSVILLAAGCSRQDATPSDVARPVKTMVVAAGGEPHVRSFPGKVEASKKVELAFQVPGLLAKLPVKEGQSVAKGEVIAQLRQDEFQARLKALRGRMIPLSQVTSGAEVVWEDPVVMRRDRFPTPTVRADPRSGLPSQLFNRVRPQIEQIELPAGYSLEWGGEHEDSADARAALAKPLPYVLALMVFIVVCLFNSIRTTLLIWLVMPLAIIFVTAGLLLSGMPFGFMALLGVLAVGGEQIKNQIVVLSKTLGETAGGKLPYRAILDGCTSKMRPVCMVVLTTFLGMIPLLTDPFFGAMAVCIMFGLVGAAVLSLFVTPVLSAIFFDVHEKVAPVAESQ